MGLQISGAPAEVATSLDRLKDDLLRAAGKNLAGLILYGGLARGRYRTGRSDVNVVVILNDTSAAALAAIAPDLRAAWSEAGIDALIVSPGEVAQLADLFPIKFLDIKEHHIVLHGVDPFADLSAPAESVRLRLRQEIRNLLLRLRRRYVAAGNDERQLARVLAGAARPIALALASLLRLSGKPVPEEDRSAAIFAAAAAAFGLDAGSLGRLAALRQDPEAVGDPAALYGAVLEAVAGAAAAADQTLKAR